MNYLLDTHVLLWWLENNPRLGDAARRVLADPQNRILVSAASVWEIGIKQAIGKLDAPEPILGLLKEEGLETLSMTAAHAALAAQLPPHHRDPFDRMLVAQARLEGFSLITHDEAIQAYETRVLMV